MIVSTCMHCGFPLEAHGAPLEGGYRLCAPLFQGSRSFAAGPTRDELRARVGILGRLIDDGIGAVTAVLDPLPAIGRFQTSLETKRDRDNLRAWLAEAMKQRIP